MAQDIIVPQMGESITEGILASWIAADGSFVNEGDPIFELETDKVTTEVPAPCSGVLSIQTEEGTDVEIGAVVASIDPSGEASAAPAPKATATDERHLSDDGDADIRDEAPATPAPAAAEKSETVKAGPAARKLIAEHNVDASTITASGKHGTITKSDVEQAIKTPATSTAKASAPAAQAAAPSTASTDGVHRKRMSTLRQRIATRLVQAQHTAAILSTFNEIDMSTCMNLRKRIKDDFEEKHGVRIGFHVVLYQSLCRSTQKLSIN